MPTDPRGQVRAQLIDWARRDTRVTGAALTGSTASGQADRWSDIDLFLGVVGEVPDVLRDLTGHLYAELGAVHHFELTAGPATYRAFLLADLLEVDVGVAPAAEFRSYGGAPFQVVFGTAGAPTPDVRPDVGHLAGLLWHHVRHARTALHRGRLREAEHWVGAARAQLTVLACARHGLPTAYAKGADRLPAPVRADLDAALVTGLTAAEIGRALACAVHATLQELAEHDPTLTARLRPMFLRLVSLGGRRSDHEG